MRDRVVVTPYDANTSRDIRASLAEALPENRRVYYDSKSGQVVVAPADSPRRSKQARAPRQPRAVELDEDLYRFTVTYDEAWICSCVNSAEFGSAVAPTLEILDADGEGLISAAGDSAQAPGAAVATTTAHVHISAS